jgi:hypothetical protein
MDACDGSGACFAGHCAGPWLAVVLAVEGTEGKDIPPLGCRMLGPEPEANNEQKGTALRFA